VGLVSRTTLEKLQRVYIPCGTTWHIRRVQRDVVILCEGLQEVVVVFRDVEESFTEMIAMQVRIVYCPFESGTVRF
jgi:hypothetical protein